MESDATCERKRVTRLYRTIKPSHHVLDKQTIHRLTQRLVRYYDEDHKANGETAMAAAQRMVADDLVHHALGGRENPRLEKLLRDAYGGYNLDEDIGRKVEASRKLAGMKGGHAAYGRMVARARKVYDLARTTEPRYYSLFANPASTRRGFAATLAEHIENCDWAVKHPYRR